MSREILIDTMNKSEVMAITRDLFAKALDNDGYLEGELTVSKDKRTIRVYYLFTPTEIEMTDLDQPQFQMSGLLEKRGRDAVASFSVYTRNYNNDPQARHPVFFAHDFMRSTFDFFAELGSPVTLHSAIWPKTGPTKSDNIDAYNRLIKHMDQENALLNTSNGKLALELGFHRARVVEDNDTEMIVDYY